MLTVVAYKTLEPHEGARIYWNVIPGPSVEIAAKYMNIAFDGKGTKTGRVVVLFDDEAEQRMQILHDTKYAAE